MAGGYLARLDRTRRSGRCEARSERSHARRRELVEAAREGVERDRRRTIDLLGHGQGGRFEVEGTPELSRAGRQLLDLRPILSSDGRSALCQQAIDRDSILDGLAVTCLRADRLEQRSRSTEIEVAHERVPRSGDRQEVGQSDRVAGISRCLFVFHDRRLASSVSGAQGALVGLITLLPARGATSYGASAVGEALENLVGALRLRP